MFCMNFLLFITGDMIYKSIIFITLLLRTCSSAAPHFPGFVDGRKTTTFLHRAAQNRRDKYVGEVC